MSLGEKIKKLRNEKSLTQKELAGDKITRNMLSGIESDKANPSLDTLRYIADALSVPVSYLLSDGDEHFTIEKGALIERIYDAYKYKNYTACINLIRRLSSCDDELYLLLAISHFELGKTKLFSGSLISAKENLEYALKYSELTLHDTSKIDSTAPMYIAITKNIQAPLLEFNEKEYQEGLNSSYDYEFYKYLTLQYNYEFKNELFKKHIQAKLLMRERKYADAAEALLAASSINNIGNYNAYAVFGIYSDLEICYKEMMDFENAYRYATKRLSLLEGFKS